MSYDLVYDKIIAMIVIVIMTICLCVYHVLWYIMV